jgi:glyoxylase-like metal-dependent hydrolase (beta-lactamase superfamily II)
MTQGMVRLDRRRFLAAATGMVAAGLLPRSVLAYAGPVTAKVGSVEITVVGDGTLSLPMEVLATNADPAAVAALVGEARAADGTLSFVASPLILREGGQTVLMDMGTGGLFGPTNGKLMEGLAAAAVDPATISRVVFTHAHGDHLFGATRDGALVLPGATYAIGAAEHAFWTNPDILTQLPAEMHGMAQGIQANLAAMGDRLSMLAAGETVLPSVAVIDTPGHTPGHICLEISGGDGAFLTGDAVPSNLVHFAHPDWHFAFDAVPDQAVATRRTLLDRAVAEKKLLVGYHWEAAMGRAEAADGAYRFVAA